MSNGYYSLDEYKRQKEAELNLTKLHEQQVRTHLWGTVGWSALGLAAGLVWWFYL